MADTASNFPATLTSIATGSPGGTTAEIIREALMSVFDNWGHLSFTGSTNYLAGKVTLFDTEASGSSGLVTASHANDQITVNESGVYEVHAMVNAKRTQSSGGVDYYTGDISIYKNGSIQDETTVSDSQNLTFNRSSSLSTFGVFALVATDYIELYAANISGTLKLESAQLFVKKIG